MKLGMKDWRPDAIKLRLGNYLDRTVLPKVPPAYGHIHRNDIPWGVLGNDEYADCVVAGAAHETMVWALATRQALPVFDDNTVSSQYMTLANNDKDAGLDPIETAKWRVSTGLKDANGTVHKVKAFASVNRDSDLDLAAYVFGACGIGFNLPDSAMVEFERGNPWSDTRGRGIGGHYVPLVGRNSKGLRFVVTWGRLQAVSSAFWRKYFVGGIAFFSLEYMLANGLSPEGIKEAQLDADLASL